MIVSKKYSNLKSRFLLEDEYKTDSRDQWGNIDFQHKDSFYKGEQFIPSVSIELHKNIFKDIKYPNDASYAVCLTHDVDALSVEYTKDETLRALKWKIDDSGLLKKVLYSLKYLKHKYSKKDMYDILSPWMDLEKEFDYSSSFFFMGETKKPHFWDCRYVLNSPINFRGDIIPLSDAIKKVWNEGFDVGLHGSYYSAIDKEELIHQSAQIAHTIKEKYITSRQHFLHYEPNTTGYLHEKVKFIADSTIGFNRSVGFRNGMAHPYYPILSNGEKSTVLQIPLVIQDGALLRQEGLDLDVEKAFEVCCMILDEVKEVNGCVAILWHPQMLENKKYFELYKKVLQYIKDTNGIGLSMREAAKYWTDLEVSKIDIKDTLCVE